MEAEKLKEPPKIQRRSPYHEWQTGEGIPIVTGLCINDLNTVELKPWARTGGLGAFVDLGNRPGYERGAYLGEIPAGGQLKPQRHMYEEVIYIVSGRGATTIWSDGQAKRTVEWQEGSFLAIPLNVWHQHFSGESDRPARYLGRTNAPAMMGIFHNEKFIFDNPFVFDDRFNGQEEFYSGQGKLYQRRIWETNFVPDARGFKLYEWKERGAGGTNVMFEMADAQLACHISQFPIGTYKKAHVHSRGLDKGGGANLLILEGEGYTLVWRPEDKERRRLDWKKNSLVVAPSSWFHQHFNTGPTPARYLALRGGTGDRYWNGMERIADVNEKEGGCQIEYENEDPEIHQFFEQQLGRHGTTCRMKGLSPHCTGEAPVARKGI
ncbi:MAG: cupin domain-containing protein [Deltaproteobacteria bacterium]|nr:cupin domain-containing protein [Deltaproteobacteria bacterium]